jgi:hypothetical protein
MRKLLLALAGGFVLVGSMTVVLGGSAAQAQSHTASTCAYSKNCGGMGSSSGSAPPGGTVTLSGHGYHPGTSVTINVCGISKLIVKASSSGGFTVTVTIPNTAVPGVTCVITASGGGLTTSTSLLVTSTTVPPLQTGEPWSAQLYWVLAAGIGLAGFGLFEFGRRRRFRSNT